MTNEQKLAAARDALHQLQIGKLKASVRYGDRTVTYSAANKADLRQYISELEALVAGETPKRGGPFPVQFS